MASLGTNLSRPVSYADQPAFDLTLAKQLAPVGSHWNVLKGDMSLVGPRPPLLNEVKEYQLNYLRRLEAAPGIIGLWQVEARNHLSFDRYFSLDLEYVENWTFARDIHILLRTAAVVFAGTGS